MQEFGGGSARCSEIDARLWTRISLADGIELHFDSARHSPRNIEALLELRIKAREVFGLM